MSEHRNEKDLVSWRGIPLDKMTREQLEQALRECAIKYYNLLLQDKIDVESKFAALARDLRQV